MAWSVEWKKRSVKELKKLDKEIAGRIVDFMENQIATDSDPRRFGKGLKKELRGLWRYRVGDYRIICEIQDEVINVLVLNLGHRKEVYKNK